MQKNEIFSSKHLHEKTNNIVSNYFYVFKKIDLKTITFSDTVSIKV